MSHRTRRPYLSNMLDNEKGVDAGEIGRMQQWTMIEYRPQNQFDALWQQVGKTLRACYRPIKIKRPLSKRTNSCGDEGIDGFERDHQDRARIISERVV